MENNAKINIRWQKSNPFSHRFEIYSNEQKIAFLKRKSFFSAKAKGEIKGKKFSFLSQGAVNKTLTIECPGNSQICGKMELVWVGSNNGILKLNSGKAYYWKCIDLFKGRWGWFLDSNNNAVTYEPENLMNSKGIIFQNPDNHLNSEMDLLILLGLHLKILFNNWTLIGTAMIFRGR